MLDIYIQTLLANVPTTNVARQAVNLVFDIGALNGTYGAGVALLFKALERQGHLQVKRLSGSSVGAFLAVWYQCECDHKLLELADAMFEAYKTEFCFKCGGFYLGSGKVCACGWAH